MNLDLDHIVKKLSENDKRKNNILLSQLRILSILHKAKKPSNRKGALCKRDIILKYVQEYEGFKLTKERGKGGKLIYEELNHEVKKTRYRDWINELERAGLINSISDNIERENTASRGPVSTAYVLDSKVGQNIDVFFEKSSNTEEAIKTLQIWLAINKEFSFFPFSGEVEELLYQMFPDLGELSPHEWIQTTSTGLILRNENSTGSWTMAEKMWKLADALRDYSKVTFVYNHKKVEDFIPCLLKEHRGKWYIFGFFSSSKKIKSIPYNIYNITEIEEGDELTSTEKKQQQKEQKAIRTKFKHSLGIFSDWHNSEVKKAGNDPESARHEEPLVISFEVADGLKFDNIRYLEIDPIHDSQNILPANEDGYAKIELTCYPDADLIREIRKIGLHNVRNITCSWINQNQTEELPDLDKWVREL